MGIGFEDVICYSFNNLESINYMKNNGWQKEKHLWKSGQIHLFLKVTRVYMYESVSVNWLLFDKDK